MFAEKYYHDNYIYIDCRTEEDITEYYDKQLNANDVFLFMNELKNNIININGFIIKS